MNPKVNDDEMILCVTTTQFSRSHTHTLTSPPIGLEGWVGGGTGTTLKQDNELSARSDGSTGGLNPGATLSCV